MYEVQRCRCESGKPSVWVTVFRGTGEEVEAEYERLTEARKSGDVFRIVEAQ